MTMYQNISLLALRLSLGWLFLYAGVTKVLDASWSAGGYLAGAKTFVGFYAWLGSPGILPAVNFLNEWGQVLIGASLILGIAVRLSSIAGAGMMILYYLPILDFPYPNPHSLIVDEHVVYIAGLAVLAAFRAGRVWGLETWCSNLPVCSRFPALRRLIG
jgi:thiosulfate dehydrogenase [quinone] large subunit